MVVLLEKVLQRVVQDMVARRSQHVLVVLGKSTSANCKFRRMRQRFVVFAPQLDGNSGANAVVAVGVGAPCISSPDCQRRERHVRHLDVLAAFVCRRRSCAKGGCAEGSSWRRGPGCGDRSG